MELIADRAERLDRFLARSLPQFSRSRLAKAISAGEVRVAGVPQKPSFVLEAGMAVSLDEPQPVPAHDLEPADIPLEVAYEDDQLMVINKPRGLATHPAMSLKEPSLVNALLGRRTELSASGPEFRPGIVHRLDKETTGLMVVAKTDAAHAALATQIESREAQRRYAAVVAGDVNQDRFKVDAPLARDKRNRLLMAVDPKGKRAVTHAAKIARLDSGVLLAVRLETGRTHQIRAHMAAVKHPVLGDSLYAPAHLRNVPLQLHAGFLAFAHPVTGRRIELFAEPPGDFLASELVTEAALRRA